MGLYHNDSLTGKPLGHPVTADERVDEIARFALTHLRPLITVVIYYATHHNKSLTARILGDDRHIIKRLINSVNQSSPTHQSELNLMGLLSPNLSPPAPSFLETIRSVAGLIRPFLPAQGGDPAQLGVTPDELTITLKVLHHLSRTHVLDDASAGGGTNSPTP